MDAVTELETPPWLLPDPDLPGPRLRRNAAGGYRITGLGAYGYVGSIETWTKAIGAAPDDHWSTTTDRPPVRFKSHLMSKRARAYRGPIRAEVWRISQDSGGLTAQEIAAVIRRSARTARRVIRIMGGYRQKIGPCGRQRWTGRYAFH